MKIESLAVSDINLSVTANGASTFNFSLRSASGSPIDIQTSVYKTLASLDAASGSFKTSMVAPDFAAISFALATTFSDGAHLPEGVATTTCAPMVAPIINHAWDMLFPSPK